MSNWFSEKEVLQTGWVWLVQSAKTHTLFSNTVAPSFANSTTLRSSILLNKVQVKLFLFANNQKAEKKAIHIVDRDHRLSL